MISTLSYVSFIKEYLGNINNIEKMLCYLLYFPEVIGIYQAELISALSLFSRYKRNEFRYPQVDELCINAKYLSNLLSINDLPSLYTIQKQFRLKKKSFALREVGDKLNDFDFIRTMQEPSQLSAALFLGFYRTYSLVTMPNLKIMGAQVASSLEEMLAILAIEGCPTQLFLATHHWILDYKSEGFSEILAERLIKTFTCSTIFNK
jgi:hypothetical protein